MPKTKTPAQIDKFRQVARELECDESDDALERVFKSIDPKKPHTPEKGKSQSDCEGGSE